MQTQTWLRPRHPRKPCNLFSEPYDGASKRQSRASLFLALHVQTWASRVGLPVAQAGQSRIGRPCARSQHCNLNDNNGQVLRGMPTPGIDGVSSRSGQSWRPAHAATDAGLKRRPSLLAGVPGSQRRVVLGVCRIASVCCRPDPHQRSTPGPWLCSTSPPLWPLVWKILQTFDQHRRVL